MSYQDYLAKSNPEETIEEHTNNLFKAFNKLQYYYPKAFTPLEIELICLAAKYHDAGKANYAFQKKIKKSIKSNFSKDYIVNKNLDDFYSKKAEIPHGYLSPAFMPINDIKKKYMPKEVKSLINAVYFHHNRDDFSDVDVRNVIDEDLQTLNPDYKLSKNYFTIIQKANSNDYPIDEWLEFAIIKGTLNRLDYAASSNRADEIELEREQNNKNLSETIRADMNEHHFKIREVQQFMLDHKDENLLVIASTGIGKTEAACLWGGDKKLFYTLPLKSSINAMYERLHNKEGFKNCALLHSDSIQILISNSGNNVNYNDYKNMRAFSYPLTVCTIDQLFTFVYKYKGSEIIPAVLKYSKVVIDEIQSYSSVIAAKLIYGLKLISMIGGKFAIITATMPPILEQFMKEKSIPLVKSPEFLSTINRHFISLIETDFDYQSIEKDCIDKKVLVICNRVDKAIEVFSLLSQHGCKAYLLHSRFQARHRRIIENDLINLSNSGNTGVFVTTQIVEASLDIDFDVLYTEMCTADSLLQRMGRCYRKREYTENKPNIFIYNTKSGYGTIYEKEIYDLSVDKLKKFNLAMFDEAEKQTYLNEVYDYETLKNSKYYNNLNDSYNNLSKLLPATFSANSAKNKLRGIENHNVIDESTYLEILQNGFLKEIIKKLSSTDLLTKIKAEAELQDYTISINPHYAKIKHDLVPISLGNGKRYFTIYRIAAKYEFDEESHIGRGLIWEPYKQNSNFL